MLSGICHPPSSKSLATTEVSRPPGASALVASPESICGALCQAPSPVPTGRAPAVSLSVTTSARQSQRCSRPGSAQRVSKPPRRPCRGGCDHRRVASRGGVASPPFLREWGSLCQGMQESPAGELAPRRQGAPSPGEPRLRHSGNGPCHAGTAPAGGTPCRVGAAPGPGCAQGPRNHRRGKARAGLGPNFQHGAGKG